MNLIKINTNILIIFFIIFIILISYINYFLYGGFGSGDDIGNLLNKNPENLTIKNILFGLTQNSPARPVSSTILEIVIYFANNNPKFYIICSIFTWLFSVLFISFVLLEFLHKSSVYLFALLSSFPFFATSIFGSPYLFTGYFTCILFWSISLFFLVKFAKTKKTIFYFSGLIFLILSLLSLEYIIPLLFLTMLFPIVYEICKLNSVNKELLIKFFLLYVLPIIIISLFFLVFKIYIVQLYAGNDVYGTSLISLKSFLQAFYYFFVIFIETPLLLFEVIPHILKLKYIIILFLITILFIILKKKFNVKNFSQFKFKNDKIFKIYLLILFITLFFSSIIFFISFYPSTTFGYYNKMMLPSFVSFSILISMLLNRINMTRYYFVSIIFSFLWISSFVVQLDNFTKSWELRSKIVEDIIVKIKNFTVDDNFLLIANVPYFLNQNYNNEKVFFTKWNIKNHFQFIGVPYKLNIWPISHRILNDSTFYPNHNIRNFLHEITDEMNIYYYQYEENKENSILEYIGKKTEMLNKFSIIESDKINYHPIIFREKMRMRLKEFAQKIL